MVKDSGHEHDAPEHLTGIHESVRLAGARNRESAVAIISNPWSSGQSRRLL